MKRLYFISSVLILLVGLMGCNQLIEEPQNYGVNFKSDVAYCNSGEFVNSYVNISGTWTSIGFVFIRNNEEVLNLYLSPNNGFEDLPNNIDIGFFTEPLTSGQLPDEENLHYHFTTGVNGNYFLDFQMNNLFIENLHSYSAVNCEVPLYIVIHYNMYDQYGSVVDAWSGNLKIDGYIGDIYWGFKYTYYQPACCIECTDETGWSAGALYTSRGSWATYTSYTSVAKSVVLYAGQFMEAGMVHFTPTINGVNIVIELKDGWSLQETSEPVKIQGYALAPNTNPNPGSFSTYKGNQLNITVPTSNYYGVHVDLRFCN